MRRCLGLAVIAALVAGCGTDPPADPIQIHADPVWTSTDSGIDQPGGVTFTDDLIIASGSNRLVVIEGETGAVRWYLDEQLSILGGGGVQVGDFTPSLEESPVITGAAINQLVLIPSVEDDRAGVAAVSLSDGGFAWNLPLVEAGKPSQEIRPIVATADIALVMIPGSRTKGITVAVATDTGQELWRSTEVWPRTIVDGLVVGRSPAVEGYMPSGSGVAALDLATGDLAWDLTHDFAEVHMGPVAGFTALVTGRLGEGQPAGDASRFIDLRNGQVLRTSNAPMWGCATDTVEVIVCDRDQLHVYRVSDGSYETVSRDAALSVDAIIVDDQILDGTIDGSGVIVDLSGAVIADGLPGQPLAASSTFIAFASTTTDDELVTVYRRSTS